ncbi:hypothetical protein [Paenibacillus lutimineralis]|uniref:Uncharacterized protein n=1 Tax=Paenibacillus lutimineralis TaxID=2707005 RepID=A0A3S9V4N7_9BACL|nr:hypothetical protein [Paenibacillus lutimineralis]AZS17385.1 hypothetical protein EI981_25170 [Paenibacillus lutimineralis]
MEKMYRAIPNSPKTEIVSAIDGVVTEIEVADSSVLLKPEGIAVIGNGEAAETITYASVEGNILKGCVRGFQGTAKAWSAGTRLARNFTAYDHDTFINNIEKNKADITALDNRLDTSDTDEITLQPGLQVISAQRDARFNLASIEGKTEINGQNRIGIIGVENPYVIRYGANLLPPFYEWTLHANSKIIEPYKINATTSGTGNDYNSYVLPASENLFYLLSVNNAGSANRNILQPLDASQNVLTVVEEGGNSIAQGSGLNMRWIKTPAGTKYIRVYLYGVNNAVEQISFSEPMLTLGTEAKPFRPREDSMLAFQTELHANPTDGSEPDELFESGGEYRKLAKWKKVVLDGSLDWRPNNAIPFTGYKRVTIPFDNSGGLSNSQTVTKYDGKRLTNWTGSTEQFTAGDQFAFNTSFTHKIQMTISNTDSGWGDAYTPTADEIKAYFMGWKMYLYGNVTQPYNGTGTRAWGKLGLPLNSDGGLKDGTTTLPTQSYPEWNYYQLLYRLAKETVEPVVSEGCLTLNEGDNVVEVGTGIVLRERAKPENHGGLSSWAVVNHIGSPSSILTYKLDKFLNFYKDDKPFYGWRVQQAPGYAYGNAYLDRPWPEFDQSVAYSVTYLKLDKSPTVPISGVVAANEKAQLSDLTAGVAEALHGVSVLTMKKAEKDAPGWIMPTLLNGHINLGRDAVAYLKDSQGFVHLKGELASITLGTAAFVLPEGYRPKTVFYSGIRTYGPSTGATMGTLSIGSDGVVKITFGQTLEASLGQLVFLAEQ